jgi:hypothetical protein
VSNHFPIPVPPPELVAQWCHEDGAEIKTSPRWFQSVCAKAARWGADMELEACCEWFICDWTDIETADKLRAARRPKPPSLKEQALLQLDTLNADLVMYGRGCDLSQIRRALEALD